MGYSETKQQDTLQGAASSMGDYEQREYHGALPRYQAEPPQAGTRKTRQPLRTFPLTRLNPER